ncbi:MAG: LLM class flavin-dependent oxidoreductase [Gaiellaceae bacterium]
MKHLAEKHGFEGLFRSDHYTAIIRLQADALDAWATLAGLAAITERIRLGTPVSPATFRRRSGTTSSSSPPTTRSTSPPCVSASAAAAPSHAP